MATVIICIVEGVAFFGLSAFIARESGIAKALRSVLIVSAVLGGVAFIMQGTMPGDDPDDDGAYVDPAFHAQPASVQSQQRVVALLRVFACGAIPGLFGALVAGHEKPKPSKRVDAGPSNQGSL